jgi:hypothetical protein
MTGGTMKRLNKGDLTIDEAVAQLTAIVEKHLESLPSLERKRRIKKVHDRVQRAIVYAMKASGGKED